MSSNIKNTNQFLRWMYQLQEQSEILYEEASSVSLDRAIHDLTRLCSKWENYIDHADRVGISLLDYREPTRAIIRNLERTKKIISKRKAEPAPNRITQPVWSLFDHLDKVLVTIGYRPVLRPLAEAFIGIYLSVNQLLNPPPTRLLLPPPATPISTASKPKGNIEKIWVEHNVYSNQKKGMTIHIKFIAHNLSGVICRAVAYFRSRSGQKLLDRNNSYRASDGQVAVGGDFMPRDKDIIFNDFQLFIPYSELHLAKGEYNLQFYTSLQVPSTNNQFAVSEYHDFQYRTVVLQS